MVIIAWHLHLVTLKGGGQAVMEEPQTGLDLMPSPAANDFRLGTSIFFHFLRVSDLRIRRIRLKESLYCPSPERMQWKIVSGIRWHG